MKKLVAVPAIALALSLGLTACGDDNAPTNESTQKTEKQASPNPDTTKEVEPKIELTQEFAGKDYSFAVPEGWTDAKHHTPTPLVDLAFLSADGESNVNVVIVPVAYDSVNEPGVDEILEKELTTSGSENVQILPLTTLDGEPALVATSQRPVQDHMLYAQQYVVFYKGFSHVLTVSARDKDSLPELADAMAASWKWTD